MARVVLRLFDDVSTDIIYPGRHLTTVLPTETPQFAFADHAELNAQLRARQIAPGSVIVAGGNFGCGSSREQAVSCLKGWDVVVVARGFARIFLQNSVNLGLAIVICPTIEAEDGDELVIAEGEIRNVTRGRAFPVSALPGARQSIVDAGGLIAYTRKRVLEAAR